MNAKEVSTSTIRARRYVGMVILLIYYAGTRSRPESAVTLKRVRRREVPREGVTGGWDAGTVKKGSMSVPERLCQIPQT